jgi:radical SAM protein with 4Fe4S-binding SPASM domain
VLSALANGESPLTNNNPPDWRLPTSALKDLREVQIEITSLCNADCPFCINRASFASEGRLTGGLSTRTLLEVLNWLAKWGISRVRFSGGEPLLRKDLMQLARHAKDTGMQTILNTNGRLVGFYADQIVDSFDAVLISMVSADASQTDKVMHDCGAHLAKLKALEILVPRMSVWVSSVLSPAFVEEFDHIWALLRNLNVEYWILLRAEPNGTYLPDYNLQREHLSALFEKIDGLPPGNPTIGIGNALPICAIPGRQTLVWNLMRNGDGGVVSEGKSKLVIDPYGNILTHYGTPQPVGRIFDNLDEIWRSEPVASIRSGASLPYECKHCELLSQCRGGSRLAAKAHWGNFWAKDPLMTR